MSNRDHTQFTRRSFVGCCACLAAAADLGSAADSPSEEPPRDNVCDPLTPQEEEIAVSSAMVKEILNVKGCSCAESVLLAALRHLEQPEEFLHSAAAFGGGMGHRDLCGLLTGGFMALGNAAAVQHEDRGRMKARAKRMTDEYWRWWQTLAPIHCRELKPLYDKDGYVNMKKRVAMKIEELIEEEKRGQDSLIETEGDGANT
jgi:C_GCAxxG_C_C family probable redox protein